VQKYLLTMEKKIDEKPQLEADDSVGVGEVFNASGHKQELERQFSLLSICSIGITTGNVWAALGGSIVGLQLLHLLNPCPTAICMS
jgi:choline transport protein